MTVRAIEAALRIDAATVVEVQEVRVVTVRRSRPIAADVTNMVETAIVVVAITRSRIPDGGCRTELAGEVHTFIGTIIWIIGEI